jgi:DNA-binding HxlR family transcriptional regulator
MPLRSDWSTKHCPIARSLDTLGDAWTLVVLRELFIGNNRFEGLHDELGIADNVLATRLRAIVDAGLADKVPYGGTSRPRYEYRLSEAGRDALPVLHALARWGAKHSAAPAGVRPLVIACATCGSPSSSTDWCVTCQSPLTVENTEWHHPGRPGAPIRLATAS